MNRLTVAAVFFFVLCGIGAARADEITLIAPGGIRAPLEKLIPVFEQRTGHKVIATFGSGLGTKKRVTDGEAFDVPIVQPPLDPVVASGHVIAATATPLATVAVAVAVQKGSPKPDISTPEAVKRMLLAATAIAYPNAAAGAAAGVSFNHTLEQLGIADAMKPKIRPAQGGAGAMALLAKGEIDIGLTFQSEMTDPRHRHRRAAAARDLAADGAGRVRLGACEVAGGGEGAAHVPVVARSGRGVSIDRDGTGALSARHCARRPPATQRAYTRKPRALASL